MNRPLLLVAAALVLLPATCWGIERVSIRREGKVLKLEGKAVQEDQAGSLFLLATDGVIWTITADEIVERKTDDTPFKPLSREELTAQMLAQLPSFKVHHTEHYLILYNTSEAYAGWCGTLYERFYAAFHKFWSDHDWKLHDPEMPLVALVFEDKESYAEYARKEIGDGVNSIVAYYNFGTNRVAMYDLTGKGKVAKLADVHRFFSVPKAAFNVATIVHEAAHQLAFNCGLHQRFADLPLWVLEGLVVYFETPDLDKADDAAWKTIGDLNKLRLTAYRRCLKNRMKEGGLERLLTNDKRFKVPATFSESYGEAWAFNYFLFKNKSKEYVEYLKALSKKEPGIIDEPGERVGAAKASFGDLDQLDEEFLSFMKRQN